MQKLYQVSIHSKSRISDLLKSSDVSVIEKTTNHILIKASEKTAHQWRKAGIKVHEITDRPLRTNALTFRQREITKLSKSVLRANEDAAGSYYYLLQFIGPVQGDWKKTLAEQGVSFVKALPRYGFIIRAKRSILRSMRRRTFVSAVIPYHPFLKIHPSLVGRRSAETAISDLQPADIELRFMPFHEVEVRLFKGEKAKKIATAITKLGGDVTRTNKRVLRVRTGTENILPIAQLEGIDMIYPYFPTEMDNDVAAGLTGVTTVQTDHALDGSGQTVGVFDGGLDSGVDDATMHQDFQGRIVAILEKDGGADTSDPDGHGSHVAGTVCGDGSAGSGLYPGMAPAAQLVFIAHDSFVDDTGVLETAFDDFRSNGASVVNNSWGKNSNAAYDSWSEAIDDYIWENRDFFAVFTAGNSGRDDDGDGVTDAGALRSTGAAKNCITVGASENNRPDGSTPDGGAIGATYDLFGSDPNVEDPIASDDISDDPQGMSHRSSRGPTDDGRIKPDIVAIGTNVLSVKSSVYDSSVGELNALFPSSDPISDLYIFAHGTSMAAPQITGMAALIRQYLAERRNHLDPSAALIKAILINGAEQLTGQYGGAAVNPHNDAGDSIPNSIQGWGRANMVDSLYPAGTGRIQFSDRLQYALATGETKVFEVHVNDDDDPFKATLVYTDAPGSGIINELYLQVEQPDGTMIDGDYNINGTINPYDDIAVNGVVNNVQRVIIDEPDPGTYRILVHAVSVSEGISPSPRPDLDPTTPVQDFALVVANATGFSQEPVSIMQVIDRSGSMGTLGYMEPAIERAKEFVDVLQINDKIGVVSFNTTADLTHANTLISSSDDKEDAKTAIDGLTDGGRTSIGAGVELAQAEFDTDGLPHGMILLSDGFSNEPPYAIDPPDGSAPVIDAAFLATDTVVYTIALGTTADTTRLSDIATATGGNFYTVDGLEDVYTLNEIYYNIQALAMGSALLDFGTDIAPAADSDGDGIPDKGGIPKRSSVRAPIIPGAVIGSIGTRPPIMVAPTKEIPIVVDLSREVRFCVSTNASNSQFRIYLKNPSGRIVNAASADARFVMDDTYKHLIITRPAIGIWTLVVENLDAKTDLRFSYAALSETESQLEVSADASVESGQRPIFELFHDLGTLKVTDHHFHVFSKRPTATKKQLLTAHSKALKKIKIDTKRFGKEDQAFAKLEVLNQQRLKAKQPSIFRFKTEKLPVQQLPGKRKRFELSEAQASGAHRYQVAVSGTYLHEGQSIPFTRKTLIAQNVQTAVRKPEGMRIGDVWTSKKGLPVKPCLRHCLDPNHRNLWIGVPVTDERHYPLSVSTKAKFTARVELNGKTIDGLDWRYVPKLKSYCTTVKQVKGRLKIQASVSGIGAKKSKKADIRIF